MSTIKSGAPLPTFESFVAGQVAEANEPTKPAEYKVTTHPDGQINYTNHAGPVFFGKVGTSPLKVYTTIASIVPRTRIFEVWVVKKGTTGKLVELGYSDDLDKAKEIAEKWIADTLVSYAGKL